MARFCSLLSFRGSLIESSSSSSSDINDALKRAIHQMCSEYLMIQAESERSQLNPLTFLATILKSIASEKTPKIMHRSQVELESVESQEGGKMTPPI
jgi:hypothetical protein